MKPVCIRLFGALRDLSSNPTLEVVMDEACSQAVFKELVGFRLQELNPRVLPQDITRLLHASALATETSLMAPDLEVTPGARLALLPPVCGG